MPVTLVTEDQVDDGTGNLQPVYDITFTIANQSGSFQVQVPQTGDAVASAKAAIDAKTSELQGIYGL